MLSIITPVFNTEHFLKQFFNSILHQSFADFELILVDDCSNDNSLLLCKEQSQIDTRIRVVESEKNNGASHARNVGMKYATGEFIMFIDSDDYVAENTLQLCMDEIIIAFFENMNNEI